jgi:hypothetical protein
MMVQNNGRCARSIGAEYKRNHESKTYKKCTSGHSRIIARDIKQAAKEINIRADSGTISLLSTWPVRNFP